MSYRLTIFNDRDDLQQILKTGMIHCEVVLCHRPAHIFRYVFCVHCRRFRSDSWVRIHSRTDPFVLTPRLSNLLSNSMHVFENDIRTEVELAWETGRLFARRRSLADEAVPNLPSLPPLFSQTLTPDLFRSECSNGVVDSFESRGTDERPDSESHVIERTMCCVEELVLEQCFARQQFDSARFMELLNELAHFDVVRQALFTKKQKRCLSLLFTSIMRKVFISLSMTRTQIDTITRLFKCSMLLLSEENSEVIQHVHTNYDSCVREALAKGLEKDTYIDDCFQQCTCFSLALDTALFGQEHIMVCTVRFVFEVNITQFPLFMAACDASTGEEMAAFVLTKLLEKRAAFSKLVSITTDGASNMIGNEQGLTACLCRLLRSRGILEAEQTAAIKNVWCFSHRLNLVTRDMRDAPGMADIFSLADWITSRRVAVSYRKFLRALDQTTRFRKIPTPSETRWLFYRDVINVVLDQLDQIVLFVSQTDQLFFRSPLTYSLSLPNSIKKVMSSPESSLRTRLLFAKYLFDVLGKENTAMQNKFSLFTDLWDCVCHLKRELSDCLEAFANNDFSRLGVVRLSPSEREMFTATIRSAITNMTVRFPCPSSSLNKRQAQNREACRKGFVDMRSVSLVNVSCPLRRLFDAFVFPDEFLRFSTIKEHLLFEFDGEIRLLCIVMSREKEAIMSSCTTHCPITDTPLENHTCRITLEHIFQHISHSDFPLLWKCLLEVRAINPTTVNCEQCFSCLKHSNHFNMKSINLCNLVGYRLTIRGNNAMTTEVTQNTMIELLEDEQ